VKFSELKCKVEKENRSSCTISIILVRFQRNLNFLNIFSKNTAKLHFMTNRPVEADVFHADRRSERQTDRHDESNSRFS